MHSQWALTHEFVLLVQTFSTIITRIRLTFVDFRGALFTRETRTTYTHCTGFLVQARPPVQTFVIRTIINGGLTEFPREPRGTLAFELVH